MPNIKFNVAKVLQSLIPIVDQSVSSITLFSSSNRFISFGFFSLHEDCEFIYYPGGRENHSAVPG